MYEGKHQSPPSLPKVLHVMHVMRDRRVSHRRVARDRGYTSASPLKLRVSLH